MDFTPGQQQMLDHLVENTTQGLIWNSSWRLAQALGLKNADVAARFCSALVRKGLVESEKRRAPRHAQWAHHKSQQSFWRLSDFGLQY
jgi:hypothetical protein